MPIESGFINGGMFKRKDKDPIVSPVITISVDDVNVALGSVKSNGGKVMKEPFKVGEMGIAAYFQDPEGNILGLWQTLRKL